MNDDKTLLIRAFDRLRTSLPPRMTVHQAIKELRRRIGKSQQIFATENGISMSGLANYERDRVPPVELLAKFTVIARDNNHPDLATILFDSLREQLTSALGGAALGFLSGMRKGEDLDRIEGLLLLSIQSVEAYGYADDFSTAFWNALSSDEKRRASGQRVMASLRAASAAEGKTL